MKNFKCLFLIVFGIVITSGLHAQGKKSRLQPGKMYGPGETLYAPRYGFTAKVPEGWEGMLPRESEIFLLMSTTSVMGDIYVFGREQGDLNTMKDAWLKGFDLTETMKLKAANPIITDGALMSEAIVEGESINKGYKGFAIARCNPSGPCITTLMIVPAQFYEAVKSTVTQFMLGGSFTPPSNASPYVDFDWKEFMSNKVLMAYVSVQGGSKENELHFCADGTFKASIKKTGFFKSQHPEYKGSNSGKWTVNGIGEQTTLQLTFDKKKLAPF